MPAGFGLSNSSANGTHDPLFQKSVAASAGGAWSGVSAAGFGAAWARLPFVAPSVSPQNPLDLGSPGTRKSPSVDFFEEPLGEGALPSAKCSAPPARRWASGSIMAKLPRAEAATRSSG